MVTNMKLTLSVVLMFLAGLISCEDNSTLTVKTGKKTINKEFNDPNRSFNTTSDGKLFFYSISKTDCAFNYKCRV